MVNTSQQHRNITISDMGVRLRKKPNTEIPNCSYLKSVKKNNRSVQLFCNTIRIIYVVKLPFNEIYVILKPMIFVLISKIGIYSSAQWSHNY